MDRFSNSETDEWPSARICKLLMGRSMNERMDGLLLVPTS